MLPFFFINICMSKLIVCMTLIDITPTGVLRGVGLERQQQSNWETVLQCLGLLTQPHIDVPVRVYHGCGLKQEFSPFGEFYEGENSIWTFGFSGDSDVYTTDALEEIFNEVPVNLGLTETARFMLPIFFSWGTLKNIHFSIADSINNH